MRDRFVVSNVEFYAPPESEVARGVHEFVVFTLNGCLRINAFLVRSNDEGQACLSPVAHPIAPGGYRAFVEALDDDVHLEILRAVQAKLDSDFPEEARAFKERKHREQGDRGTVTGAQGGETSEPGGAS